MGMGGVVVLFLTWTCVSVASQSSQNVFPLTSRASKSSKRVLNFDLEAMLLTPSEQIQIERTAQKQLEHERDEELYLAETDMVISAANTSVGQHRMFTYSALESLQIGRNHRLDVIKTLTAVQVKQVPKSFLPKLLPNGFGARSSCPTEFRCNQNYPYRRADGLCNNLWRSHWGEQSTPLRRWLTPHYDDGVASPRERATSGGLLPSARLISTTVHDTSDESGQANQFSHMLMQWGQFLTHDISATPTQQIPNPSPYTSSVACCSTFFNNSVNQSRLNERPQCFPIAIPANDKHFDNACMNFVRSVQGPNANCQTAPVEQLNQNTAFLDASNVYGSTYDEQNQLRTFVDAPVEQLNQNTAFLDASNVYGSTYDEQNQLRTFVDGQLKTGNDESLPEDYPVPPKCRTNTGSDFCFLAGDRRVNMHPGLQSIHTVFLRAHNHIALQLKKLNCHWDDEKLFQESRRIIGAAMQVITYRDYLPIILGPTKMAEYGLDIDSNTGYQKVYNPDTDASVYNAFSTAAFRMGHSMIRSTLGRYQSDYKSLGNDTLHAVYGSTHQLLSLTTRQVGHYCRGLMTDSAHRVGSKMTREVTDLLFKDALGNSFDLAALNIQRGRDHGLPPYTAWRSFCGLAPISQFDELVGTGTHTKENMRRLQKAYSHVDDIDLFSGGLTEKPVEGGLVGPTFACLLARQFKSLKEGDRFWFEEDNEFVKFNSDQLTELRKLSLSTFICDHTDTANIQPNAFLKTDTRVNCEGLDKYNLLPWKETVGLWSDWSMWSSCEDGVQTRTRTCNSCSCADEGPNTEFKACGQACGQYTWGWSTWSAWGQCNRDRKSRKRMCRCPGSSVDLGRCVSETRLLFRVLG